jgi:branched-chain amino acid transport system ATP-binding protein
MARPKLLLLDEPSMGLAPQIVNDIFRTIREINETGTTVLLVEQNAKKALSVATYGYVLETGRISFEGSANDLLKSAQIVEAYLGATS